MSRKKRASTLSVGATLRFRGRSEWVPSSVRVRALAFRKAWGWPRKRRSQWRLSAGGAPRRHGFSVKRSFPQARLATIVTQCPVDNDRYRAQFVVTIVAVKISKWLSGESCLANPYTDRDRITRRGHTTIPRLVPRTVGRANWGNSTVGPHA